jgi:hypothetical protein
MKTYSLITKPYRIRLNWSMKHTLTNAVNKKFITFEGGTEFWCAKAYSQDHSGYKSLFLFNHSFCASFALGSKKLSERWEIIECHKSWRDEVSILQTNNLALNLFCDGTVPKFVPKEEII